MSGVGSNVRRHRCRLGRVDAARVEPARCWACVAVGTAQMRAGKCGLNGHVLGSLIEGLGIPRWRYVTAPFGWGSHPTMAAPSPICAAAWYDPSTGCGGVGWFWGPSSCSLPRSRSSPPRRAPALVPQGVADAVQHDGGGPGRRRLVRNETWPAPASRTDVPLGDYAGEADPFGVATFGLQTDTLDRSPPTISTTPTGGP